MQQEEAKQKLEGICLEVTGKHSTLARARALAQGKDVYRLAYPQTAKGGNEGAAGGGKKKRSNDATTYSKYMASRIGESPRQIDNLVAIGIKVDSTAELKLTGTRLANATTLLLVLAESKNQRKLLELAPEELERDLKRRRGQRTKKVQRSAEPMKLSLTFGSLAKVSIGGRRYSVSAAATESGIALTIVPMELGTSASNATNDTCEATAHESASGHEQVLPQAIPLVTEAPATQLDKPTRLVLPGDLALASKQGPSTALAALYDAVWSSPSHSVPGLIYCRRKLSSSSKRLGRTVLAELACGTYGMLAYDADGVVIQAAELLRDGRLKMCTEPMEDDTTGWWVQTSLQDDDSHAEAAE